jgi:hypothetical protein
MTTEPTAPTRKKRRRVQQKRRSDAGSTRFRGRDATIIRFAAEQTFARSDSLGEELAPDHLPAVAEPPASQLTNTAPPTKRPWPADARHRAMAVAKLLNKLATRGYLEVIQPWSDQPPWCRATALGLRRVGLDWPEIPFPAEYKDLEARLRHDDQYKSHNHLINQVRLLLARGGAGMPTKHIWKGERAIEAALPPREKGTRRPHKADGVIRLEEDGAWEVLSADRTRVQDTVSMKAGQIIGIEIECSQKNDHRLDEILPDLVAHHDFVWYFCLNATIKQAVVDARLRALTDEQRRRVRILLLEDYLPCP